MANNLNNAVFIRKMELGTYDFTDFENLENCRIEPEITMEFLGNEISIGKTATLSVRLSNPYKTLDDYSMTLVGVQFTHQLPAGLTLAADMPVLNTCNGTYSGLEGDDTFSLSGVVLNSSSESGLSECTLNITVQADNSGTYLIEQPKDSVTSAVIDVSGGANKFPALATLTVNTISKTSLPGVLPSTGFAPGQKTNLPAQPAEKRYTQTGDLWLEIPKINLMIPIVGVPNSESEWDVTWLGNQAGWLQDTTFPTLPGNAALTGHIWNAYDRPGPFHNLDQLTWGDQIIVHVNGIKHVFEVRSHHNVLPDDVSLITQSETYSWVNLITCKGYSETSHQYLYRYIVRAVLVEIEE